MKRQFGLFSVFAMVAVSGCDASPAETTPATSLDSEQATLVAALAANEDGSDEAWTSASGDAPFVVEACGFDAIVARVVERFDSDGDGELSDEERAAIVDEFGDPSDRLQVLMAVYDADGSGSLEAGELELVKADLETRCANRRQALVERFDANGDGTLDADEREAAREALGDRFAARHAARVGEFDRNGDGRLGPIERRRAGQDVRERVQERREELVARFDADGNGELDETERAALQAHLRRCVRGEEPLMPPPADEPASDAGASP